VVETNEDGSENEKIEWEDGVLTKVILQES